MSTNDKAMRGITLIGHADGAVGCLLEALDAFDTADRRHWDTQLRTGTAIGDERTGRAKEQALMRLADIRSRFVVKGGRP